MKVFLGITLACSCWAQSWTDLGSGSILHNSAYASGLYGALVNCGAAPPPAYCVNIGASYSFLANDQYVEAAQSGAAIDTVHNHLYITGGGHNDYYGNQFYDYNIAANTLTRLTDPSPAYSTTVQFSLDGTAASSHTEQGLVYLPNEDAVFKWGIGVGAAPKEQTFGWWITNPRTNPTWVPKAALPTGNPYLVVSGGTGCTNGLQTGSFTNGGGTGGTFVVWVAGGVPAGYASLTAGGSGYTSAPTAGTVSTCTGTVTFSHGAISGGAVYEGGGDVGSNCVLDTTSAIESVLCIQLNTYQLYRYTPSLDTGPGASPSPWTALSAANTDEIVTGATCRINPALQVLVCVGLTYGGGGFPSGIYSISLASGSSYAATNITSSTTGCSGLYSIRDPGFEYDSSTGLFVGYNATGNGVILYNYATQTCTTQTITGGPTSAALLWGMYDRFAYFPSLNKYIARKQRDQRYVQSATFGIQLWHQRARLFNISLQRPRRRRLWSRILGDRQYNRDRSDSRRWGQQRCARQHHRDDYGHNHDGFYQRHGTRRRKWCNSADH